MVIGGQVDDRHLLSGGAPGAVERDGIGGAERAAVDRVGIADESLGFGTPGLLARFAVVWKQVVVPGNPVHGGGERVDVQPALVETIGKIPCFSHETRILTGRRPLAPGPRVKGNAALVSGESRKCKSAGVTGVVVAAAGSGPDWLSRRCSMSPMRPVCGLPKGKVKPAGLCQKPGNTARSSGKVTFSARSSPEATADSSTRP